MSVTQTELTAFGTETPDEPAVPSSPAFDFDHPALEAFHERIWHNREICNNCFARCTHIHEGHYRDANSGEEHSVTVTSRTEHGTTGIDERPAPESTVSQIPLAESGTACAECGSVRLRATDETLSKQDAVDRVEPLAARLEEQGFAVNRDVFYTAVRHLKSQPETRGYSKEVFAAAAHLAVDD